MCAKSRKVPAFELGETIPPNRHERIVRTLGKTVYILTISSLTFNVTIATEETPNPNPASVAARMLDNTKNDLQLLTGQDLFCPPAPIEEFTNFNVAASNIDSHNLWIQQEAAKANGLSFIDKDTYNHDFDVIERASSSTAITEALNDFSTANFAVTTDTAGFGTHPDQIPPLNEYRLSAMRFMWNLSLIPKEIIEKTHLTSIEIRPLETENQPDTHPPVGMYDPTNKKVTLDIRFIDDPNVFLHEVIGHGVNFTSCQGYPFNDRAIIDQNPSNYHYLGTDWFEHPNNPSVNFTRYGQTSDVEDTAEDTAAYLSGLYSITPDNLNTPLARKVITAMDNIDELAPGAAEYLRSIRNYYTWGPTSDRGQ